MARLSNNPANKETNPASRKPKMISELPVSARLKTLLATVPPVEELVPCVDPELLQEKSLFFAK